MNVVSFFIIAIDIEKEKKEMNNKEVSKQILHYVGGAENVSKASHCYTRLRLVLNDFSKANKAEIEKISGVRGVVEKGGQLQIVIGNDVDKLHEEFSVLLGNVSNDKSSEEQKGTLVDTLSAIFFPVIGLMCASGLIKGLMALCVACGWLSDASTTYMIINGIGDTVFYYLPAFLGYTTAKRFGGSPFLGVAIGLALVYPNILALASAKPISVLFANTPFALNVTATIIGIPTVVVNYSNSVFPVVISVWVSTYFEKTMKKVSPSVVKSFFPATATLLVMVPLTLIVIGPIVSVLSSLIATGISAFYAFSPILASIVIAFSWQLLVLFGVHGMLFPLIFMNLGMYGFDTIFPAAFACSFTQVASCVAMSTIEKDADKKSISLSAAVSAFFGITEPAIYGVTLPNKKAFISTLIGSACGGFILGLAKIKMYIMGGMGVIGFLNYISPEGDFSQIIFVILAVIVAMIVTAVLTVLLNKVSKDTNTTVQTEVSEDVSVVSPLSGIVHPLSECSDETFAKEIMGKGCFIDPKQDYVTAPVDGVVSALFPTNHAIGITADNGAEILVHVGIDTVELNGKFFKGLVKQGDKVSCKDRLVEFDSKAIRDAGYKMETMVIVTNSDRYNVSLQTTGQVSNGDVILKLERK